MHPNHMKILYLDCTGTGRNHHLARRFRILRFISFPLGCNLAQRPVLGS